MTRHDHSLDLETARQLTLDTQPWLSCDDCFDQVDSAVERLVREGTDLTNGFRAHLVGCPACREEAEGLVTLVAAHVGVDASLALDRLDRQLRG
jgi:hypothetical protein